MHIGVLQAAIVLLEETNGEDPARATAAADTVALLRAAISQAPDPGATRPAGFLPVEERAVTGAVLAAKPRQPVVGAE
ncbi:hypothetical protein [Streptomyces sp. NPDC059003]|uniref:hypothetical protein n=1 Tax=Streptomyces sp. NPDC059003 TaxID=3346691 RepID=UPI003693FE95